MSMKDEIEKARELYFQWLCMLVHLDEDETGNCYIGLGDILHSMEFYSLNPMDENRIEDGLDLRTEWLNRMQESGYFFPETSLDYRPASVLEVLVGMAVRCENQIMWDPDYGDRTYIWFWDMLSNLLDGNHILSEQCTNETLSLEMADDVRYAVENFLERAYDFDGTGGLFPLRNPRRDQRQVELWTQMNQYMLENYRF